MKIRSILLLSLSAAQVASINPITVSGRKFIDSVTGEEFFIKGVDYQPGGSSLSSKDGDPLSNSKTCARDIALFQKLKINTVRVYNIDTSLNHDECMSLLAAAGIYLVLDVNSPLTNRHLNRYEPWATYTRDYLKNIFQVVQQFSTYNNTLGFFAGNEIVNDPTSATKAPIYVKAVIRDLKNYIKNNLIRKIPVGYSAADNLDYRISLSKYLECTNNNPAETVDFYGVNSYQWCGDQTFYTSGYNILVDAYKDYSKPVFFSEYGCNTVRPRLFTEVKSIFSPQMTGVFKGGLVYEFTEEPNNYGLVRVLPNKDLQLLQDFHLAILQFNSISSVIKYRGKETKQREVPPKCQKSYRNLFVTKNLPPCVAQDLVNKGVKVLQGSYVELTEELVQSPYKIFNLHVVVKN
ncbi:glycolipid anchored surface protein GAS1 [Metschnikowia bicuspidata]|uniref:1,3-beta-glucanosyltransferase n=1 Tax=Metschnikowia bicuspidata TaxID=27322 RepID=A0A4P9Z9U9_9ASCO|nr:glycolipid anchored surface protein GAS1 [Metschnikowia bicuspidata]